jgi:hypothetical protein
LGGDDADDRHDEDGHATAPAAGDQAERAEEGGTVMPTMAIREMTPISMVTRRWSRAQARTRR